MKFSIAIADTHAPPTAFVVWRGFDTSIPKARRAGYDGVELALRCAEEIDTSRLRSLLDAHGMAVSAISTGQVYAVDKLSLSDEDAGCRRRAVEVLRELIHVAAEFGGMLNLGRVRGPIASERSESYFIENARVLCDEAAQCNVEIVLEPVNRYELNFINNLDEGMRLVNQVGKENFGLMPDLFHMNIEDDDLVRSLRRNFGAVKYLHLADSNRLSPGWGHTDFHSVFRLLAERNYSRWASVEILPKPDPDQAAFAARETIGRIWSEINQ